MYGKSINRQDTNRLAPVRSALYARQRMKATAYIHVAQPVKVAVTRRSRPALIGSTIPTPLPAKPDPLTASKKPICAVGVVRSKTGRISALAGR